MVMVLLDLGSNSPSGTISTPLPLAVPLVPSPAAMVKDDVSCLQTRCDPLRYRCYLEAQRFAGLRLLRSAGPRRGVFRAPTLLQADCPLMLDRTGWGVRHADYMVLR